LEQVLFGGYWGNPSDTSTWYSSLASGSGWASSEASRYKLISTDGLIKNLRVVLNGAPGGATKYTFTLMVDGAPTALTLEIVGVATSGSNMVNEIDVTPGQTVSLQCDPEGTPTLRKVTWTSVFEGDTPAESLIMGGASTTLHLTDTEYGQVMGAYTWYTVIENDYRQVVPTAGTIKHFYVKMDIAAGVGAGDAYRFTLRLNGATVAQSLIVTITQPATTGSDLAHNLVVAAGDILTMMIEPILTPSATPFAQWGMTFVADTDGESIVLGGSVDDLDNAATEYIYLAGYELNPWINDETQRYQLGQVCTLSKFYVLLSAAPGAGNDYDFAIRIAGTNVVTLQISDAATTGNSGALSDTVALDEYVNLRCIPTDTPDVVNAYWGLVCYLEPPIGWTGKISGVTNPAKIAGVDVANIASVKGVA